MRKLFFILPRIFLTLIACQSRAEIWSVTASDKSFFEQIRKAVLTSDSKWLSEAVSYPLVLRVGKKEYKLQNKKDFINRSGIILTLHLKSTIQSQSPEELFKNWQGVMIGNGEVWFSEVEEANEKGKTWVQRIIAINLPANQSEIAEKGK